MSALPRPFPARSPAPSRRRAARALALAAAVALLAALALSPAARAEKGDREKPINYSADTGDVNYQTKVGTLTGNVTITQGTLSIRADRIVFRQNPDNSLSASAYGNPVSFRQKRDGADEYFEGYAQRAEYDGTKELLELFDRALLRRGQDDIRSNYISYNAATELFKAEGRAETKAAPGDPGARVRGTFQPKGDSPLPGAGKGKDAGKAAPAPPAAPLKPAAEIATPAAK
jgi:lipopolysaccharide export system protein LptA